jgi:hypothetical protein
MADDPHASLQDQMMTHRIALHVFWAHKSHCFLDGRKRKCCESTTPPSKVLDTPHKGGIRISPQVIHCGDLLISEGPLLSMPGNDHKLCTYKLLVTRRKLMYIVVWSGGARMRYFPGWVWEMDLCLPLSQWIVRVGKDGVLLNVMVQTSCCSTNFFAVRSTNNMQKGPCFDSGPTVRRTRQASIAHSQLKPSLARLDIHCTSGNWGKWPGGVVSKALWWEADVKRVMA